MPDISVVIPARDAAGSLERTLAALAGQEFDGDMEVVVVDNGSRDATAALAEASGVRVLRRPRGEGPGPARNAGAAVASAEVLAFTDADCAPTPGWLAAALGALVDADIVLGPVAPMRPPGSLERATATDGRTGLFESANLVVRRPVFERAEGFPPGLEGPGDAPFGEDVLFGWRAVRGGARVVFCPEARVLHAVEPRSARAFIAERTRLRLFPALVAQVPELREAFCYRRYFLTRRSAAFDLAVAAGVTAIVSHRALPLLLAAPYARSLYQDAARWGQGRALATAAVRAAADAVGGAALASGSIRSQTLLL